VVVFGELVDPRDTCSEAETSAVPFERAQLRRERLTLDSVRRDRETDELADLFTA